jgi:UDP-GlcNAc:undecaprenyl-phosphate/decaprenyl-phosphate GlcNAc-1-phosphate transferase
MLSAIPIYILIPLSIVLSAVISMYSVKKIIFIAQHRKIYDIPDDTRKIHGPGIPSLGGIGIFIGYITVAVLLWPQAHIPLNFILPSSVVLVTTGIYDDMMNMRPLKKLLAQLLVSFTAVYFAHIRITSFYGIFGITDLPVLVSAVFTTVACTFFINVFNFVDGIDGLACVTAIFYALLLGTLFAVTGHDKMAWVAFSLAGAAAGLLYYNLAPARIYMGDTGSMLLGFTIFILSVAFINSYNDNGVAAGYLIHRPQNTAVIIIAILFPPVYDAIRVFILRASRGVSPLRADRTHLHYYLLDAGCTHTRAVAVMLTINIVVVLLAFLLQDANPVWNILVMILVNSLALLIIYRLRQKRLSGKGNVPIAAS